jgi:hypothetical protein
MSIVSQKATDEEKLAAAKARIEQMPDEEVITLWTKLKALSVEGPHPQRHVAFHGRLVCA